MGEQSPWEVLKIADEKKYYWLRLKNDFFGQKEIKKLRQIAGGDTFTIIYLKMQLLSITNGGVIEFEGTEESLAEQLSFEIDEDIDNIKITLTFLISNKLIEQINDSDFLLNKVPELIGAETTAAERMRKMRIKRNNVTPMLQPVTKCYTEIEIEKEIELEIKKEVDNRVDYQLIADMYNDTCVSFPRIKTLSDARKKAIKARFASGYTEEKFKQVFELAEQSDFLKGANSRNWQATFDWLIKDANMAKVLDGNYANKAARSKNKKQKLSQSSYDIDELEEYFKNASPK